MRRLGGDWQLRREVANIDQPPPQPNAMDDEFLGSALDTSKWTWLDQGATVDTVSNRRLILHLEESANRIRGIYQSTPGGNWRMRAKILGPMAPGSQSGAHLFTAQSTTQQVNAIASWGSTWRGLEYATPSSAAGNWLGGTEATRLDQFYAELEWTSPNLIGRWSADGESWVTLATDAVGFTPAIVGLGLSCSDGILSFYQYEWFRRVA